MKTRVLVLLLVLSCSFATAQTARRGYLGISLGASFPLGAFQEQSFDIDPGANATESTSIGLQLSLVHFGYLFTDHVGIAATWFGAAYPRESEGRNYELDPWSCGAIVIGPLFTATLGEKLDLDFRPMIGYSISRGQIQNTTPEPVLQSSGALMDLSSILRIHTSEKVSLMITMDVISTKFKVNPYGSPYEQKIVALSVGGGIAFRLK